MSTLESQIEGFKIKSLVELEMVEVTILLLYWRQQVRDWRWNSFLWIRKLHQVVDINSKNSRHASVKSNWHQWRWMNQDLSSWPLTVDRLENKILARNLAKCKFQLTLITVDQSTYRSWTLGHWLFVQLIDSNPDQIDPNQA